MKDKSLLHPKHAIPLIGMLIAICSCAGTGPVTKVDLGSFLEDVEKKAYLIQQFSAEFVKTRRSEVFNQPLTVNARLVFQKPGTFLLAMTGDVNVEILSDGHFVTLIHDKKVEETHQVQGERDLSRFADPLMLLIDQIGTGALRRLRTVKQEQREDSILMEVEPASGTQFERIRSVTIVFSVFGEIRSVDINFKNGDEDRTVFENWALLAEDDPEILQLKQRLKGIAEKTVPTGGLVQPGPHSARRSLGSLTNPSGQL
jgi:outer membrane lipoprotein-sorting protein